MWVCECGHKNSNNNISCHGKHCKGFQPLEIQIKNQNREARMNKQKDLMSRKIQGEGMMRGMMKMFKGMK